eukprot:Tamp_23738.p3 GENE.Tamp_23738~~Tamp_23738.p3  ORF type:complete len:170 (+),score=43.92 Tamp_23738:45-512(+)
MGNAHPKAGKSELNGRLKPGAIVGATGQREIKSMLDLEKAREKERKRKELKAAKKEQREAEREWEVATQVINEGMVAHILKPFHEMTGIECVASHAEPDEEEEVSDYEDEKPAPRREPAKEKRPTITARQRVGMMMAKANQEELEGSESEEEAEC